MNKTMTQIEDELIAKNYGAKATPILHKDKSIAGLIAANCPKKERSVLTVWKMFGGLKAIMP